MAIRVKITVVCGRCGRTAVIPCLNGFTAEVREIKHGRDYPWCCILALVPKDFPIDSKSADMIEALEHKDDPTKKIFGIDPNAVPYNVK